MTAHTFPLSRRALLGSGLSGLTLASAGATAAFAAQPATTGTFVLVILRGALDGLAAVAPLHDPAYLALRGRLALGEPGTANGALDLGGGFGLNPALPGLHALWRAGQMNILHACATPYRDRSHFDGQDVLESGAARLFGADTGWLNRLLGLLPAERDGVGIGRTIPLVLRGPAKATSWAPPLAPETSFDTLSRLMDLYAGDSLLGPALSRAIETDAIADGGAGAGMAAGQARGRGAFAPLASAAARILTAPGGPAAAVIGLDGWDTHANQGAGEGLLANRLGQLDQAITALRVGLGAQWATTHVVIATEFGRTVRVNGTGGTDHGTGGTAFHLGGAVRGGRMLGDWPGLARLHEDRDLIPANDLRRLFASSVASAWGLDTDAVWQAGFARV